MANAKPPELWNPETYERARKIATSDAFCCCGAPVPEPLATQQYDCGLRIHCGHCDSFTAVPNF